MTVARGTAPPAGSLAEHLRSAPNLLNDLVTLAPLLVGEVERGCWLDAFLLAAGMAQLADDRLEPEIWPLDRAARYLTEPASATRRIAARALAAMASAGRVALAAQPATRRALRWKAELERVLDALAGAAGAAPATAQIPAGLPDRCRRLARDVEKLPRRLRRSVLRLPSCFHELDLRPADLASLVEDFTERRPDRGQPLLVAGVRTSGSYLAPLCAAQLRAAGYEDVDVVTIRPGRKLPRRERRRVRTTAARGGLALLVDDPPVTGGSLAAAAAELERSGLAGDSVILLLGVLGSRAVLPAPLRRYEAVLLPSARWTVAAGLAPAAVEQGLSELLGDGQTVDAVEPLALPPRHSPRSHARARFRARVRDDGGGEEECDVLVEGVGLGYLGKHEALAARALEDFAPRVFGIREGLLYREWLPDESRVGAVVAAEEAPLAAAIGEYVARRRRAFPIAEDIGPRLDDAPAWEVASSIISRTFGAASLPARVVLTDRAVRRLLGTDRPSVIDGNTDPAHWFRRNGAAGPLAKVDLGDQLFSNFGLRCFDAAFDLAGATARRGTPSFTSRLRRAYADRAGEQVDEERWLLYELAHLWGWERTEPAQEPELRRARARALQRYFAEVYLSGLQSPAGALCALDIDGVLETEHLGFPALSPASALALRALIAHGFRPLPVSGRGLEEVAERCRTYGLAGGVAEYGAALYETRSDVAEPLLPADAAAQLRELRAALRRFEGVQVDASHRFAVRAFRLERGRRTGLEGATIAAALSGSEGIRAIAGEGQTDFAAAATDKGTGLRALSARLDPGAAEAGEGVALAVGDTPSDVPMVGMARSARAPRHAHPSLRRAGFEVMRRPYQAGLAQAVTGLIGHPPGGCEACRMPPPSERRRILLSALAVAERGRLGMPLQALRLAYCLR